MRMQHSNEHWLDHLVQYFFYLRPMHTTEIVVCLVLKFQWIFDGCKRMMANDGSTSACPKFRFVWIVPLTVDDASQQIIQIFVAKHILSTLSVLTIASASVCEFMCTFWCALYLIDTSDSLLTHCQTAGRIAANGSQLMRHIIWRQQQRPFSSQPNLSGCPGHISIVRAIIHFPGRYRHHGHSVHSSKQSALLSWLYYVFKRAHFSFSTHFSIFSQAAFISVILRHFFSAIFHNNCTENVHSNWLIPFGPFHQLRKQSFRSSFVTSTNWAH